MYVNPSEGRGKSKLQILSTIETTPPLCVCILISKTIFVSQHQQAEVDVALYLIDFNSDKRPGDLCPCLI